MSEHRLLQQNCCSPPTSASPLPWYPEQALLCQLPKLDDSQCVEFYRWPTHNIMASTGKSWSYTGLMAMVCSLLHWVLKTLTATKSIPRVLKRLMADVTTVECLAPWRAHSLVQLLVSDFMRNRNQIIPLISNIVPKSIGVPIPQHAWISARAFNYL